MRQRIKQLLEEAIPYVDFDGDFLFAEMDSLGVTTVLMILSEEFGIELSAADATPRNLKSLDSIVALVEAKQAEKK
ncbi:MAG: acyl carrier protein [Muribaculaceae bacterium]|nr:acyl carrier protein [Muribaculaceae bacterium]MDY3933851.1 acyl carrier protein [Muribaculaceae bacterium]